MFLLDTNVASELQKPRPERRVVSFIADTPLEALYVSDVTLAEIRFGIEDVDDPSRRLAMQTWLDMQLRPLFFGRVLSADENVWLRWKTMQAAGKRTRYTFPQPDLVIAAIAAEHGFTVVTRDVAPFAKANVKILNPWLKA